GYQQREYGVIKEADREKAEHKRPRIAPVPEVLVQDVQQHNGRGEDAPYHHFLRREGFCLETCGQVDAYYHTGFQQIATAAHTRYNFRSKLRRPNETHDRRHNENGSWKLFCLQLSAVLAVEARAQPGSAPRP